MTGGRDAREGKQRKQIHLGAHFPGVNNTTVWSDPDSGSQIEFESFVHLAETAERGLFDFFFLAEGLREHWGRIHDLDVVGRPNTFTVLAALGEGEYHCRSATLSIVGPGSDPTRNVRRVDISNTT